MTNNQLTDERVTLVIERLEHYACNLKWTNVRGAQDLLAAADGLRELQERRKAAMDSEPVAWTDAEELSDLKRDGYAAMLSLARKDCECADPRRQILLFTHPAPSRQRDQVRQEHSEWSQATFGNVSPVGPLKHLSKEALEAAAEPGDLSEWADMQFLLWDAQRRAGITDEQITQAMIEKLAVNKQRKWPAPKDGEPRLHIKEQPAPVVPEEKPIPNTLSMYAVDAVAAIAEVKGWNACRAAMLQELKKSAGTEAICRSNENVQALNTIKATPALGFLPKTDEVQNTNSPVIPDGYVMVPVEPNGDMLAAAQDAYGETDGDIANTLRAAMLAAAPQSPGSEPATVPGKWIPVSERMPEREVDVQVYCPDKKEQMVAYLERNELDGYFRFATWRTGDGIYCQPTHWMPLPAAPQEVKGE